MQSTLIDRDAMILELADLFGVPARTWRQFDQATLNHAWLVARARWD